MTIEPSATSETVTCAYPSEVGDGQPCGFAAESVVDVVRSDWWPSRTTAAFRSRSVAAACC